MHTMETQVCVLWDCENPTPMRSKIITCRGQADDAGAALWGGRGQQCVLGELEEQMMAQVVDSKMGIKAVLGLALQGEDPFNGVLKAIMFVLL